MRLAELLRDYRIVDLSVTLADDMPCVWPGHQPFEHKIHNWYATVDEPDRQPLRSQGPYYTAFTLLDEHAGTHFDAPPHFVPPPGSRLPRESELGREYGDRVPLEDLQGPAVVVDVRRLGDGAQPGVSPRVTAEFLAAWERRHG